MTVQNEPDFRRRRSAALEVRMVFSLGERDKSGWTRSRPADGHGQSWLFARCFGGGRKEQRCNMISPGDYSRVTAQNANRANASSSFSYSRKRIQMVASTAARTRSRSRMTSQRAFPPNYKSRLSLPPSLPCPFVFVCPSVTRVHIHLSSPAPLQQLENLSVFPELLLRTSRRLASPTALVISNDFFFLLQTS